MRRIEDQDKKCQAVEIAGVCKRFGDTQALDQLNLTIGKGAVFGFLGPNGAGKTTTLRALLGLVRPEAGRLSVLGLDPLRDGRAIRRQVGVLLEHDGLYERLSAWNNLDYHARLHRLPATLRRQRIEELLRSFDLWERRRDLVGRWSKGMRQKLAVARTLVHRPDLLLLDEPFSGLDPVAAVELRHRIVRLSEEQEVTVLLTTHDLAHVEKCCGQVAVVREGRVIAQGTPERISTPAAERDLEVEVAGEGLCDEVLSQMQREGLLLGYDLNGRSALVTCGPDHRPHLGVELVRRGVRLEHLSVRRDSLEDALLTLLAEPEGDAP